ncbi:hypothetical protein FS827_22320 [Agrobacterium vitis]|uniref:hypothetical protein n=1 Tax=Allorhizobium ampelinum TaxID=3025782 RepID=UPI001F48D14D|nr:hypothetical protein [Allorhizobium ampelinum]MCF1464043.1 hypothetical protein [Allorhizobium ampelinum]
MADDGKTISIDDILAQKKRRGRTQKSPPERFKASSAGDTLFELAFLKTHMKAFRLAVTKEINGRTIYRRLCTLLRTSYIDLDAPPSDYIKTDDDAGSRGLRAFTQVLNNSAEFRADGLRLSPGDFSDVENMGQLGGVIVDWYRNNGWRVSVG